MTTRSLTGLLAKPRKLGQDIHCTPGERAFQIAFGVIQWPWLLKSLYGGTQAKKRELLDRLDLTPDALPHLGSWKADTYLLHRVVDLIEEQRPATVVELGSGATSLVIARALARNGEGQLHSYDQHLPFISEMHSWLAENGLEASFSHAPLVQRDARWPGIWYDLSDLPPSIDLLVVDGPPWAVHPFARGMAERLFPLLRPGGVMMLDDAARPGERYIARRWRRDWPEIEFSYEGAGTKGLLIGRRNLVA